MLETPNAGIFKDSLNQRSFDMFAGPLLASATPEVPARDEEPAAQEEQDEQVAIEPAEEQAGDEGSQGA